jgi:hypothetical protein
MTIEAMKLALEALDIACRKYGEVGSANTDWGRWDSAMTALRAAIEQAEEQRPHYTWQYAKEYIASRQAEQEPVAWIKAREITYMKAVVEHGATEWKTNLGLKPEDGDVPLYTAPPQRESVYCGCGDEIVTGDGARCGTCVAVKYKEKEWVGFTQEEHQAAMRTDGSFGAGFLYAEKLLKEKNT